MSIFVLLPIVMMLVLLGIVVLVLLYLVSKADMQATRVETGGLKFKMKSDSLLEVMDNFVEGFYFDQKTKSIVEEGKEKGPTKRRVPGFLEKTLGIFWVSWIYPIIHVHEFEVIADKVKPKEEIEKHDLPIRKWIEMKKKKTTYLRFRFQHPVLVPDIELIKDKWQVDLLLMLDVMVRRPIDYIFDYKGSILEQVDAAVIGASVDYFRTMRDPKDPNNVLQLGYDEFVAIDKGSTSKFADKVMSLNEATTSSTDPDGLIDRFGVEIRAVWVWAEGLVPEDSKEKEASKAKERERNLADGEVEKARGIKAIAKAPIEAMKEGLKEIADSLEGKVTPEGLAVVLEKQVSFGNLKGTNITTLVMGNSNVTPTVEVNK